jgi:hypothetical protein
MISAVTTTSACQIYLPPTWQRFRSFHAADCTVGDDGK